jgi:hypothetical protein
MSQQILFSLFVGASPLIALVTGSPTPRPVAAMQYTGVPMAKPLAAAVLPAGGAAQPATPGKAVAMSQTVQPAGRLAKYEPAKGVYLGAALDYAKLSGAGTLAQQMAAKNREWNVQTGRKHAIVLQFVQFPYEKVGFPTWDTDPNGWATSKDFAESADAVGATPLITLEPMNFWVFFQNWKRGEWAYDATEKYAQAVGAWGKPVFIRFAHEMNGTWYPWSEWTDKNQNMRRDPGEETGITPADYRTAYRNVAALFRKHAPNAALVWCPNSGLLGGDRRDVFRPFYPGDDVVDWVGLDIYERGWSMPMPGSRLWGGQFAYNLTRDAADDPDTENNESVNFYDTFVVGKNKPLMVCETSATLSFRTDLAMQDRAALTHSWKTGYWNPSEYGWMQAVYGTTQYKEQSLLKPIDTEFPRIKAVVWFQVAKREWVPVEKNENGKKKLVWFNDSFTDYRIGGGAEEGGPTPHSTSEMELYRKLTNNSYFLSSVK